MTETCPCGATYVGPVAGAIGFRLAHSDCLAAWRAHVRNGHAIAADESRASGSEGGAA